MKRLPLRFRVLRAVYALAPLGLLAGGFAAFLGHRFGAYILLFVVTGEFALHRLQVFLIPRAERAEFYPGSGWTYAGLWVVMLVGLYIAVFGARVGAYVMLLGFAALGVSDLLVGLAGYRKVMHRPWPKVPPLEDDDW